jgi:hypothetical protein
MEASPEPAMVRPEGAPRLMPRVSWGSVFAGAVVAVAIGLMLNTLGAGVFASMVDTTQRETPSGATMGIGAAVWLLVANLIGLAVGGYVAARLSGNADETDSTLHGLAVWATSFLITAVLVGNVVAGITSTAATSASNLVGGLARGAGAAVPAMSGQQAGGQQQAGGGLPAMAQGVVDRVQNALSGGGDPGAMTSEQRQAEMATLVTRRVTEGSLSQAERDRLNALVAAEYGLSPEQAQQRVQQAEQTAVQAAQRAEERAREAADAAATGTATAAFAVFGTMLLGALAAALGARRGTRALVEIRDRRALA